MSAILLNDDYYQTLQKGRVVVHGFSVLRPEYLILFKAKAYLDLKERKRQGEQVDSINIKKHKNDIARITAELRLESVTQLPPPVQSDIEAFFEEIEKSPFEENLLKLYGLRSTDILKRLRVIFE